jgi:TolB-like protein/tetratricopeptide (TPR) repeat protein
MEALAAGDVFQFDGFRLDRRAGGLSRRDERGDFVPMAMGSRALDVLGVLVERPGDLVSRDAIIAAVWPATVVEDANLNMQIAALRRVLDQGRAEGSCIQTIPGRGYRFTAMVTRVKAGESYDSRALLAGTGRAPRLSIIVLPFTSLGSDPEQQYFAAGITEDLTTDLSRIPHMFVISRNTAFTYKDKRIDTKQIGRELGVRYLLEGSVRRSGNRVRVNAQLIDAETNAHLWADRFDGDTLDLFALRREITSPIAIALNTELVTAEVARPTKNPDALDYILRGRAAFSKPPTRSTLAEAIDCLERALALHPRSVEAQSLLAYLYAFRVLNQMTDTRAADMARAEELVAQPLAEAPRNPFVHLAKGQVLRMQGRYEEAIPEYEAAIASDPNPDASPAIAALGHCKLATGPLEEAIALMEQAIRLSPGNARVGIWYYVIGRAHLLQSRIDEAILWLEKARRANPQQTFAHAFLASAYALKNETERANAELAEARRLSTDGRFSSIARLKAAVSYGVPEIRALHEATFFAGLRKAGMPEG